jgi:hypothetical protein
MRERARRVRLRSSSAKNLLPILCCIVSLKLLLIFCSSGQSTALHRAAYVGHSETCQLLIASKSDVNATNRCAFVYLKFAADFVLYCVFEICF